MQHNYDNNADNMVLWELNEDAANKNWRCLM